MPIYGATFRGSTMHGSEAIHLSEFDLKIISALQADGRRSNTEIARELQVAESTVRRRLDWLVKSGVIQVMAITDPLKVGFPVWIIGQLEIEVGKVEAVVQKLERLTEVTFIAITTGSFDVLFTAIFRSTTDLYSFLSGPLSGIGHIRKIETSLVLRLAKRRFQGPPISQNRMTE